MWTIELTERRTSPRRLHPDDASHLQRAHGHHLRLAPTHQRHRYRLTPTRLVGLFHTPRSRILIHAKLPHQALLRMLDPKAGALCEEGSPDMVRGDALADLLAGRFLSMLEERLRAGLHREYVEHHEEGMRLRGRLDLPRQLREAGTGRPVLHSRWEEMTEDIPCNQMLRAVVEQLLRTTTLTPETRRRLHHYLPSMESITPKEHDLDPDAQPEEYRPLLTLGHWLLRGLQPGAQIGEQRGPCFLLDLERLLEQYVTRELTERFAAHKEWRLSAQPHLTLAEGEPSIMAKPDLLLKRAGKTVCILDMKWKHLKKSGPETGDLYQIIAYCAAWGARRGILIYPGRRSTIRPYRVGEIEIETRMLPVAGTAEECCPTLTALARSLTPTVGCAKEQSDDGTP